MKQLLLFIVFLFVVCLSNAQPGDFIIIKKNGQTFKTFFQGGYITFRDVSGEWFNSRIENIRHDSLFFREVIVRQVPTPWGVPRLDTMTNFMRKVHYRDIVAMPKKSQSFSYIKNGMIFMIGGGGFILLNVVNSAYMHYSLFSRKNSKNLLAGAGVFAAGLLIRKYHKNYITIGSRYKVEYINVQKG